VLKQVINLEWGNFRSPYLPRTFADEEVDRDSVNSGDQVKVAFAEHTNQFVFRVVCKMGKRKRADGGSRLGCCCSGLRR
jgi:hexokinase